MSSGLGSNKELASEYVCAERCKVVEMRYKAMQDHCLTSAPLAPV
jgi:hypothetical protein